MDNDNNDKKKYKNMNRMTLDASQTNTFQMVVHHV